MVMQAPRRLQYKPHADGRRKPPGRIVDRRGPPVFDAMASEGERPRRT